MINVPKSHQLVSGNQTIFKGKFVTDFEVFAVVDFCFSVRSDKLLNL